jgi:hypothetical protein
LEWQDSNLPSELTWLDAISYCENLVLDDASDWYLPNRNQLISIIDFRYQAPSLSSLFQSPGTIYFWSSTSSGSVSTSAYMISVYNGFGALSSKTNENEVRCVRSLN